MTPEARRKEIALLTAKEIFELVREDLLLVEQELARQSATAFEPVSEITGYLLGGGGKRMAVDSPSLKAPRQDADTGESRRCALRLLFPGGPV